MAAWKAPADWCNALEKTFCQLSGLLLSFQEIGADEEISGLASRGGTEEDTQYSSSGIAASPEAVALLDTYIVYFNPGRHRFKGDLGLWRGPLPESLEVIATVHRVTSRYQHVDFCLRSGASLSE